MKLKVCGMKYNTVEVTGLQPDYLGFIFYEKSARFFNEEIEHLPESIKKVGVFVNATANEIKNKIAKYNLDIIQLHGEESHDFCKQISIEKVKIIKVFSVDDSFDFSNLKHYLNVCDFFLFDAKGKLPGGNGFTFNWDVLSTYPYAKPYFLSGGIGLENIEELKEFSKTPASKYCYAVDVNSKFEIKPGLKDTDKLSKFKSQL